ncbi:MAG: TnsA endonuclease C-terminal domain-containing protein [Phormidium sp.]
MTRIKGIKTKRVHHFLSQLELNYFYLLEWSNSVVDIREQYPLLPIEETVAIAQHCQIRHPRDPKTQNPIVMTTDFLISHTHSTGTKEQARTVKTAADLQSERTIEKLEIERQYWLAKDIDWGIVTEHEIPMILAKNIGWLHPYFSTEDLSLSDQQIRRIATALTLRVATTNNQPLAEIAADCDDALGLPPGIGLSVARHLIANRQWLVDMNQPIQPSQPLILLAIPSLELQKTAEGTL